MSIDHETLTIEVEEQLAAMRDDPALFEPYDVNGNGVLDADEEARLRTLLTTQAVMARSHQHPPANHTGPGRVLAERFELQAAIGKGGQGSTWRALDRHTGAEVVVKELHMELAEDWKAVELFERECAIVRQLSHPGIPAFVDAFTTGDDGDGLGFFLVQELIDGADLQVALDGGERFGEDTVRRIVTEVLAILTYLHGRTPPVVHRDIKPANLILRPDGSVALVDFGAIGEQVTGHTIGSTMVGTTGYMAPEQLMGRTVTASDQYGLAATAVHLLCRRHPSELPMRRMRLQFRDAVSASEPFVAVLERMLDPMVESRFPTTGKALEVLNSSTGERPTPVAARRDSSEATRASNPGRGKWALALAVVVILAVAGLFVVEVGNPPNMAASVENQTVAVNTTHPAEDFKSDITMGFVPAEPDGFFVGLAIARPSLKHGFKTTYAVSGVVSNVGDYSHTDLKVQVDAFHGDTRVGGKVETLVPSYAPPLRSGDQEPFNFYLESPKPPTHIAFRPLTSNADSIPTQGYPPSKSVPLKWVANQPEGVRLGATLRRDETSRYGSHTLWLQVRNLGDRPLAMIKLEKRLYDAKGKILVSKESYVHASSDPPLPAGHAYQVSLLSNSHPEMKRWSVQVAEVSVWEPPTY